MYLSREHNPDTSAVCLAYILGLKPCLHYKLLFAHLDEQWHEELRVSNEHVRTTKSPLFFQENSYCWHKIYQWWVQKMLISERTVLTTVVVSLLGILLKTSVPALAKLLAFFCLYLDICFCRNMSTENLSLQILHDTNKETVGVLIGKKDLQICFTGKLYKNVGEKKESKSKDHMSVNLIYLTTS